MKKHSKRYSTIILVFLMLLGSFTIELLAQEPTPENRNISPPPMTEVPDIDVLNKPSAFWDYLPRFITQAFESKADDTNSPRLLGEGKPAEEMSILLDGESGYLRIPNSPSLNLSSKFTIEAWICPAEITTANGIIEKYEEGVGGFSLSLEPQGVLELHAVSADPNALEYAILGTSIIAGNEWRHVAVTYDGGEIFLYLDGKLEAQSSVQPLNFINNADLTIGLTRSQDGESFFKGTLDEIRISNFARYTENFVPEKYLYGGGVFGQTAGAWRFSDQKTEDTTGNNNHATISGKAYFVQDTRLEFMKPKSEDIQLNVSPQALINFDNVPTGTYLHNVYPDASFYETSGYAMYSAYECLTSGLPCAGQSLPNFARAKYGTQNVVFIFAQPVSLTRFDILAVDEYPGSVTNRLSLRQDGVFYTYNVISSGWNVPLSINVTQLSCGQSACDRVTQVNVHTIFDYLGLGYDNFSYTIYSSPTPNPTPNCLTESSDDLDPCPPQPTPTPENVPNPPHNLRVDEKQGEVEIKWSWASSQTNPRLPTGFKIYRADKENGEFVEIGDVPITTTRSFSDISTTIKIDEDKFYNAKSYNEFGLSGASETIGGSPISPCSEFDPPPTPPAIVNLNAYNWTGTIVTNVGVEDRYLEVRDVRLKGRLMAKRLSFAAFRVHEGRQFGPNHAPVPLIWGAETAITPLGNNLQREGVFSEATYCTASENGQHHWKIKVRYEFDKREPAGTTSSKCEPFGDVPCSRFRPSVHYEYFSPKKFERLDHHIVIGQRLHYRENDDLSNTIELFEDCDYPYMPGRSKGCAIQNYPIVRSKKVINEDASTLTIQGRMYNTQTVQLGWDNTHQTGDEFLGGPSPIPQGRVAGCMSCVHDHWRWPKNEPALPPIFVPLGTITPIDYLDFRPGSLLIGDDYFGRVGSFRTPIQEGYLRFTKYKPTEEYPPSIPYNGELIYRPSFIRNAVYYPAGGDYVTWYTAASSESPVERSDVFKSSDTIHAHRGFFAEVQGRNVETPVIASDVTFFKPLKVVTENLYKADPTIPSTFGHGRSVPPLPPGYSYIGTSETRTPVLINYSRSPFAFGLIGSGEQTVTFQITDTSVSLNNLRVLYLATNENRNVAGWTDITHGAISTGNRTIEGKFDFYAPGGYVEQNVRLFSIVRKNTSAGPEPDADMAITGTVLPEPVRSGNNLTYNWTVTNNGPSPATEAGFMQVLSPHSELISATTSQGVCDNNENIHGSGEPGRLRCSLGNMSSGSSASVTVVAKVEEFGDATKKDSENMELDSTAYASANEPDKNPDNDGHTLFSTALPSLNQPPTVAIISPGPDALIVRPFGTPTTIPVTITASDNDGSISEVELVDNGNLIGTATSNGNNTFTIGISEPSYGLHSIVAFAKDNGGRSSVSAQVSFTVNSSSTVTITSPTASQLVAPGTSVNVETQSNVQGSRLQKIELFLNGELLGKLRSVANTGNVYQHRFTWSKPTRGRHTLKAVLTELSGATTTTPTLHVVVDSEPSISILTPKDGASVSSGSVVAINTSISHPNGHVNKIEYFANGTLIGTDLNSIASGTREFKWQNPSDGIYSLVAVATDDLGVTSASSPVNIGINRPGPSIGEMIWVDDNLPVGAAAGGDDGWNWMNTNPASLMGSVAHQSLLKAGLHEHYFENASFKLQVNSGEKLSTWVFLDPDFPPAEIMLQWKSDQGWDHRAYWGQNLIDLGTDGTNSRRRIGDIPTGVGWKQLKIPANLVGLEEKLVNGMKFTVHGGRVAWDRVGKLLVSAPEPGPPNPDFVWIDDAPPAGSLLEAVHDTWTNGTWINFNPSPNTGSLSHRHWQNDFNEPYRQRSFSNAPSTMAVNPGDTLFAYVYLYPDSQYRPDTLLLQWLDDSSGWVHRAYWGRDSRDRIAEKAPLPGAGHSTEGWRYMGPIPASGGWVKLEVPASYVGLEGKNVKGMAFGIYQKNNKGRAVWDSAGRTSQPPTVQPVNLKYTTPLWRYKCGSGSGERLYYTPINDHNFLYPDCTGKVNSGYVYGYGAPGTVALHSWQNGQVQWLLNICDTCTFPGWNYRWYVGHTPTATMTDTTPHKNWSCNNNHHYTSYPNAPDTTYPTGCTFIQDMNHSVHTR